MASYDGHAAKRQRTNADGHGVQSGQRDQFEDPHKMAPSPVLHVRGLMDSVIDSDLIDAVQRFGTVSNVIVMPRKRQALVEFDDINSARNCVNYAQTNQIFVCGQPAFFNFSRSQKIEPLPDGQPRRGTEENHILLLTIHNPQYPITVEVLYTICSPSGEVKRIVIFKKHGLQAMVEFDSIDSARRARQALNGADIYSGCCTLKIEYAKTQRLNVFKNDSESWDYTNPDLGKEPEPSPPKKSLLPDPSFSGPPAYGNQDYGRGGGGYGAPMEMDYDDGSGYGGAPYSGAAGYGHDPYARQPMGQKDPYGRGPPGPAGAGQFGGRVPQRGPHVQDQYQGHKDYQQQQYPRDNYGGPPGPGPRPGMGGQGPPGGQPQGAVLMVYGLNSEKMNCDRLFNLMCLYGNVIRVKFLKSKDGTAMVQMGDPPSVDRVLQNINHNFFFDSKVQVGYSKQAFLQDVPNPHELTDGTPSFKDYMGSRNNRFANPEAASKNRIQPPAKVLHFFNAPPDLEQEQLFSLFTEAGGKAPIHFKKFPTKSERSSTGLIEWENKADAIEALVMANHTHIPNPNSKHPYVFKLCFSSSPILSKNGRD